MSLFPPSSTFDLSELVNKVPPTACRGHVAGGGSLVGQAGVDPTPLVM